MVRNVRYHLSPEHGPRLCNAKIKCKYADADGVEPEHYSNKADAEKAYEEQLELEYSNVRTVSSGVAGLLEKLKKVSVKDLGEVQGIGAEFNHLVEERVGFGLDDFELDKEEWDRYKQKELLEIGKANRELISEIFETGDYSNKIKGYAAHKYHLEEVLKMLPNKVLSRVSGDINLKIERNTTGKGGTYKAGAVVYVPSGINTVSSVKIPENSCTGDYVSEVYFPEDYLGLSVNKIIRSPGESLLEGESVKSWLNMHEDLPGELLRSGAVDSNWRITDPVVFQEQFPEIAEKLSESYATRSFYVGKKPSLKNSSYRYRKVGGSVEIMGVSGNRATMDNLYDTDVKGIDYSQHTITGTKNSGETIMLHEYSHAVQRGGIPGEKELFQELSKEGELKDSESFYSYYNSAPDNYMMETSGRELFTRATEGFYYPQENSYLYGSDNVSKNSKKIRDWVTGVWLLLGREDD